MTISDPEPAILARLLQLASPALPVGGYSYSQGLEAAVEMGWVHDARSAARWIGDVLEGPVGVCEAGFLAQFLAAWRASATGQLLLLDARFQASRESSQLLAETRQMGWSLLSLLRQLPAGQAGVSTAPLLRLLEALATARPPSYLLVWSGFACALGLPDRAALATWLWSWLENQVMVALKTVPLGQNAGQALLFELGARLDRLAAAACAQRAPVEHDAWSRDDQGPGNLAPGFGLACAGHENQYSRLFRS